MIGVRFIQPLALSIDLLVYDFDPVAGDPDDAFDVMRMILEGEFEYDDVTAANGTVRQEFFVPRVPPAKNKFVYQQMIAHKQSGFHGLGGNLEGLDDKRRPEQRQNYGNQERLDIFAYRCMRASFRVGSFRAVFGDWRNFSHVLRGLTFSL